MAKETDTRMDYAVVRMRDRVVLDKTSFTKAYRSVRRFSQHGDCYGVFFAPDAEINDVLQQEGV